MIIDTLMNSTEVQNPPCKLDDKCLCLSNVFGSVLACAKFAHVSKAFLLAFADFVSNNSFTFGPPKMELLPTAMPQTKAFLHFIAFSGSPTAVLVHCMHYGITLWAYLFAPLVKTDINVYVQRKNHIEITACSVS